MDNEQRTKGNGSGFIPGRVTTSLRLQASGRHYYLLIPTFHGISGPNPWSSALCWCTETLTRAWADPQTFPRLSRMKPKVEKSCSDLPPLVSLADIPGLFIWGHEKQPFLSQKEPVWRPIQYCSCPEGNLGSTRMPECSIKEKMHVAP